MSIYHFAGYRLDPVRCELSGPDQSNIPITRDEGSILAKLCSTPQKVVSRTDLHPRPKAAVTHSAVTNAIARIRRKIETNPSKPEIITNGAGGYVISVTVTAE